MRWGPRLQALQNIRAERRAGELLREMVKNAGARGKGVPFHDDSAPTLAALGLNHSQSHRWQRLAAMDALVFERYIAEIKAAGKELTSAGVYREARQSNMATTDAVGSLGVSAHLLHRCGCVRVHSHHTDPLPSPP